MARFVRCIEGHAFDSSGVTVCPICGAIVDMASVVEGLPGDPVLGRGVATSVLRTPVLVAVAVLVLGLGIVALFFAWRATSPVTIAATDQNAKSEVAQSPPLSSAQRARQEDMPTGDPAQTISSESSVVTGPETQKTLSSGSKIDVSATLRGTLDVVRMLVAFSARDYRDAASRAELLVNEDNPLAMYVKGGILQNGLAGPQDAAQARRLLAAGAQLGDPTSALFFARMLEKGIGGSRDLNQAQAYYLLAARGLAAGADQDLTRLHIDGRRGMNALEAYQSLTGPEPAVGALNTLGDLFKAHSTPAICFFGWLVSQSNSRGWLVTNDPIPLRPADAKQIEAVRAGQIVAASPTELEAAQLKYFRGGALRSDPWCEWGMGMLSAKGVSGLSKNLVEADVFYRLAAMNAKLGAYLPQVKQELASVETQMTPTQRATADHLFHNAIPTNMAP